jgi:hypothetical protein
MDDLLERLTAILLVLIIPLMVGAILLLYNKILKCFTGYEILEILRYFM